MDHSLYPRNRSKEGNDLGRKRSVDLLLVETVAMNHVEKLVLFRWIQGLKPQPEVLLDPPAKLCTAADVFRTFAERIKVQEKGSMLRSA